MFYDDNNNLQNFKYLNQNKQNFKSKKIKKKKYEIINYQKIIILYLAI